MWAPLVSTFAKRACVFISMPRVEARRMHAGPTSRPEITTTGSSVRTTAVEGRFVHRHGLPSSSCLHLRIPAVGQPLGGTRFRVAH